MFSAAIKVEEMASQDMKKVRVGDTDVLIIKRGEQFYATESKCPHLFMPLEKGKLDGDQLQCKFHRAVFDIKTGDAVKWANFPPGIQALNFVRGKKCLKTFATKVENGQILVDV